MSVRRIGKPPPQLPPFVIERIPHKQMLTMTAAQLQAVIDEVTAIMVKGVGAYHDQLCDTRDIRREIEAAGRRVAEREALEAGGDGAA